MEETICDKCSRPCEETEPCEHCGAEMCFECYEAHICDCEDE
jgi:hypothetical protein